MNIKSIAVTTIVGSVVYFLLGWVFYGMIFTDIYPQTEGGPNLLFIYMGGLVYSKLISIAITWWANTSSLITGLQMGAIIGVLVGMSMNFFMFSAEPECNWSQFITDSAVTTVMSAMVGAVIAVLHGKLSK